MASEQLKLVIDVATAQAVKETKNLAKAVQNVGTEEADLRSAADRTADALDAAATAMIADLKRSESAAAALGKSLGPELAGKIGEAKIDSFIGDLRRMGLTFEEIEGNSDRFATSLRKMDDATGSIQNVEGAVTRLGHESDNSRSVLANMVGNSVQDLGQLGGVAGSAGVMIGQLAEYAADGNISLSGLATFAGPMAAVGLAAGIVSNHMEQVAKSDAFNANRVEAFAKALRDGATAAEAWDSALNKDKNKIEFVDAATGDVADFTHTLAESNVTWKEFRSHLNGSVDEFHAWAATAFEVGDPLNHAYQTGTQLIEQYAAAQKDATETAIVFPETLVKTTEALSSVDGAAIRAANSIDIMNAAIAGGVSLQGSYVGVIGSLQTLQETLGDSKKGWVDQQNAIVGAQNSVINYVNQLGGIPSEKLTQILALISQGNVNDVVAVLNEVTQDRTIHLRLAWREGGINPSEDMPNMPVVTVPVVPVVSAPVHSGGGGGGGGKSGKTPAETEAEKAEKALKKQQEIEDNKYQLGLISDAKYKEILQKRLAREEKYSDEYTRIAMQIRGIDDKTAKAKAEHDRKAHEAAQKAKKDREDAKRAAEAELQRRANEAIVNANILGASYANIYTSADPNAVVNAIQQWQRRNGPVPIKVTG